MNGPSDDLRASILEMMDLVQEATDQQAEEVLEGTLLRIEAAAGDDLAEGWDEDMSPDDALDALGAIEAWAGLASAAVAKVYAPASPWPRRSFAGWATSVARRLRQLAQRLLPALSAVGRALSAVSWSVGVSFPFGISVSIAWS